MGLLGKTADAHISGDVVHHVRCVDAEKRYIIAHDAEVDEFGHIVSLHFHAHFSAFRPAQALHYVDVLHFHSGDGSVIDFHNAVAGENAYALRRSTHDSLNHIESVFFHVELNADAAEVALQRFFKLLGFGSVGISGVGVELIEHALYGVLHEAVIVDAIHIELTNCKLCID